MMITRRAFASVLGLLGLAPVATRASAPERYGRVDVERCQREGFRSEGARVLLDGLDITADCTEFDDVEGWADVLLRTPEGRAFLNPTRTGAAKRRVYGRITVDYQKA